MDKQVRIKLSNTQNVEIIASSLSRYFFKNQLMALENTLKHFKIQKRAYTLFGERDESMCLAHSKGKWIVFYSEKGIKTNRKEFDNPKDACLAIIYAMADNRKEYQQMVGYYNKELKNNPAGDVLSEQVYKMVRSEMRKIDEEYDKSHQKKKGIQKEGGRRVATVR